MIHLNPNSTEPDAKYLLMKLDIHTVLLTDMVNTSITLQNIVLYTKQGKSVENICQIHLF